MVLETKEGEWELTEYYSTAEISGPCGTWHFDSYEIAEKDEEVQRLVGGGPHVHLFQDDLYIGGPFDLPKKLIDALEKSDVVDERR